MAERLKVSTGDEFSTLKNVSPALSHDNPAYRRSVLVTYLRMKTDEEDWHAVADAAMDLREHDARYRQPHSPIVHYHDNLIGAKSAG